MWDMAVCLHNTEPCGFSSLFCVAVVTLVTAHDVSVIYAPLVVQIGILHKDKGFLFTVRHLQAD